MKKRILLIEEDEKIYLTMKNILKILESTVDFKISLDYIKTFNEAKIKLKKYKYDLLIFEFFIKDITTESFLLEVKEKYQDTKINILTSIRDYAILKKLLKSGASRIIYKPLSYNDILVNIKENLFKSNINKELQNV